MKITDKRICKINSLQRWYFKIEIERFAKRVRVNIHTAKPGMVIGKGGAGIETLKKSLEVLINNSKDDKRK